MIYIWFIHLKAVIKLGMLIEKNMLIFSTKIKKKVVHFKVNVFRNTKKFAWSKELVEENKNLKALLS